MEPTLCLLSLWFMNHSMWACVIYAFFLRCTDGWKFSIQSIFSGSFVVFMHSDRIESAFFVSSFKMRVCTQSRCTFCDWFSFSFFFQKRSKLKFISQYGWFHERNIPYESERLKKLEQQHIGKYYIIYSVWHFHKNSILPHK